MYHQCNLFRTKQHPFQSPINAHRISNSGLGQATDIVSYLLRYPPNQTYSPYTRKIHVTVAL